MQTSYFPPPGSIRSQTLAYLAGVLALTAAPHVLRLPPWIIVCSLAIGGWRVLAAYRAWPLPGRGLCLLLALTTPLGVYLGFGTLLGREAGVALLVVMLSLKLLETRDLRDGMVVVFLGYFLIVTNFLYSQSIPMGLYMLLAVLLLTSALIDLNRLTASLRAQVRLAGALLLQALPLMLVLFVLFPRIAGPLWGFSEGGPRATTGLDDKMSPGSISGLAASRAVAFRAAFQDGPPKPAERYWRGPVFWFTDGRSWSAGPPSVPEQTLGFIGKGPALSYTVTLEPHYKTWLFALDLPATVPEGAHLSGDFQLLSETPVENRMRYQLRSYPYYETGPLTVQDLRRALELPANANPRTRALAQSWRAATRDDVRIIRRALAYFAKEPFYYSLNPPRLSMAPGDSPIDEFLFDTRRGFCEHFASAFATLMRAAHIPARVVTGYQGGEFNPVGGYLIVRQSDAHAWVEVWLKGRGWVRIDPTAAVAPERIERGATLSELAEDTGFAEQPQGWWGRALVQLHFGWDTLNYEWGQWVLSYGPARQSQLLSNLGLRAWTGSALALGVLLGLGTALLFSAFAAYFLLTRHAPKDAALALYQRFCAKLTRHGITRAPHEGPADFALRAAKLLPEHAREIHLISDLYITLRYGRGHSAHGLTELRHHVRSFGLERSGLPAALALKKTLN